jgi:hypothetical protein
LAVGLSLLAMLLPSWGTDFRPNAERGVKEHKKRRPVTRV